MGRNKAATIKVPVNDGYYGIPVEDTNLNIRNEFEPHVQKALAKIAASKDASLYINGDNSIDQKDFHHINTLSFRKSIPASEPKLVYEICKLGDQYYIRTGLYVGVLYVNGIRIEINTGYHNCLLRRMLNVANDLFFDSSTETGVAAEHDTLSLILEYLFLSNFRDAFAMGIPTRYERTTERGFNFKGRLDINEYITKDMLIGSKMTYSFNRHVFSQNVIDVLYMAMNSLATSVEKSSLIVHDYAKYYHLLKQLYSGKRVAKSTIRNIEDDKSLKNPMYSRYKKALKYARYILEYKGIMYEDSSNKKQANGFILDVSELWEIYLAKLLSIHFGNHSVISQVSLDIYPEMFFKRTMYPDIVLETDDSVSVIDAKFKRMQFRNSDIDRNDLHQIHAYAGYFKTSSSQKLKLCSLIHPTETDPSSNHNQPYDNLYGLEDSTTKFAVEYIKVGASYPEMIQGENEFIARIGAYL